MIIYDFIRSSTVAEHCRTIGKTWNTFEMALIISRSARPLAEKHAAWRELIAHYPDMPAIPNIHKEDFPSIHQKLREIMDFEERVIEKIMMPEPGAVYTYKRFDESGENCGGRGELFSSYEKAVDSIRREYERDEVSRLNIKKSFIDADEQKVALEATTDYEGSILWLSVYGEEEAFGRAFPGVARELGCLHDLFFVDIPTPFKRGDILCYAPSVSGWRSAVRFVLDGLVTDDAGKLARALRGELCDGTDLCGWGYFATDDGMLYGDHTFDYDSFEYYHGKLEGNERILHYASLFIKGKIDLPALLNVQCRIAAECDLKDRFITNGHGAYIAESLLAENRATPLKEVLDRRRNGSG